MNRGILNGERKYIIHKNDDISREEVLMCYE